MVRLQRTHRILRRPCSEFQEPTVRFESLIDQIDAKIALDFSQLRHVFAPQQLVQLMRGMLDRVVQHFQPCTLHALHSEAHHHGA